MNVPAKKCPRQVPCPSCGEASDFVPANRWRPFCSARCAGVDLGAWASEGYSVAAPTSSQAQDDSDPDQPRH